MEVPDNAQEIAWFEPDAERNAVLPVMWMVKNHLVSIGT
ncbi:hypothetical protein KP78_21980 [Jeotgalibacillus soli]|uniref:Uncharacterized protein n=1 Tax=Jeotgalibacillus soli TaxID=889306 RepID=A0A0C2RVQ7_9BACL|nr:hypothetical protein KP78_21980 [Jeotgalibacillus soli]